MGALYPIMAPCGALSNAIAVCDVRSPLTSVILGRSGFAPSLKEVMVRFFMLETGTRILRLRATVMVIESPYEFRSSARNDTSLYDRVYRYRQGRT